MFNIDGDGESLVSCDQPQAVKFVCFFIRECWGFDCAFLIINPLLTEMLIFIDVDVKTIEPIPWI